MFQNAYNLQGNRYNSTKVHEQLLRITNTLIKPIEKSTVNEIWNYIEELKQIAAENFDFYIHD